METINVVISDLIKNLLILEVQFSPSWSSQFTYPIKLVGLFQYCINHSLGVKKCRVKRNPISPKLETSNLPIPHSVLTFSIEMGTESKGTLILSLRENTYFHFFIMAVLTRNKDTAELCPVIIMEILRNILLTLSKMP